MAPKYEELQRNYDVAVTCYAMACDYVEEAERARSAAFDRMCECETKLETARSALITDTGRG